MCLRSFDLSPASCSSMSSPTFGDARLCDFSHSLCLKSCLIAVLIYISSMTSGGEHLPTHWLAIYSFCGLCSLLPIFVWVVYLFYNWLVGIFICCKGESLVKYMYCDLLSYPVARLFISLNKVKVVNFVEIQCTHFLCLMLLMSFL